MSKSSRTLRSTILLFVVSVAVIAADLVIVSAQGDQTRGGQMTSNGNMQGNMSNSNGGSTNRRRRRGGNNNTAATSGNTSGDMGAMQGNTGDQTGTMTTNTGGGRRRRRRRGGGNANTSGDMTGNANMTGTTTGDMTGNTGGGRRRRRRRGGGTTATGVMTTTTPVADSVQTDLSGTYTGTLACTGAPVTGEGTLTITGNQFTFAPSGGSGSSVNGRLAAVTTRGYTAVAMQFGESVAPPPGQPSTPPFIVSLRARKAGDNLTLTGVSNSVRDCSFTAGSPVRTGGRRRRRSGM